MITFVENSYYETLREKFDVLTEGMEDWKMPIDTVIPVRELNVIRDACEFMTGSKLYVVKQVNEPNFGDMRVKADGYYIATGD